MSHHNFLKILGNGQIWDLKGVSSFAPQMTFEDLFSGRALGRMAGEFDKQYSEDNRIFSRFKEKDRITGLSVTQALLSNNQLAKKAAKMLLKNLAKNAVLGIEALTKGRGFRKNWSERQKNYWKNLNRVIIGGGVSEGLTGKILVNAIKKYLSRKSLSDIKVSQAKFPGKEAGILGAVINLINIKVICQEAKTKGIKIIAAIGLDLGREEIGVGLLAIDSISGKMLKQREDYRCFKFSLKTPYKRYLNNFLDCRQDYTENERKLGEQIRRSILKGLTALIIKAQKKAQALGLTHSQHIGVAVPGATSVDGYIISSTDYLPFFRKQDGFNFAKSLEEFLREKKLFGYHVHIINDGIAAGIANVYFGLSKIENEKFAFLGVGSGLGGCVGRIMIR